MYLQFCHENVTALQKVADGVEMKLQKFFNQMKSTERQAAILLNVWSFASGWDG